VGNDEVRTCDPLHTPPPPPRFGPLAPDGLASFQRGFGAPISRRLPFRRPPNRVSFPTPRPLFARIGGAERRTFVGARKARGSRTSPANEATRRRCCSGLRNR